MTDQILDIRKRAKALVDAVQKDDCGMMIGQEWVGGNGGLLSRETLKAADDLRLSLAAPRPITDEVADE